VSDSPPPSPSNSRPRALTELPTDALLARAAELARRWAIALAQERPLERLGEIPLGQLALDGPSLCAQALRALQSDVELERLTGGGAPSAREPSVSARSLAQIAGARGPGEVVEAVELLRGVLWGALLEQLRPAEGWAFPAYERSPARRLLDVADRLAYVCASVAAVAAASAPPGRDGYADCREPAGQADPIAGQDPLGGEDWALGERGAAYGAPGEGHEAVIVDEQVDEQVDERMDERAEAGAAPPERALQASARAGGAPPRERPLSWDESPPVPPSRGPVEEIEIRDQRREHGASAWTQSIGRQLDRFEHDGRPFAALLVEIVDVTRPRRDEPLAMLSLLGGAVQEALAAELRAAGGQVTEESAGRYWVLAPKTDRGEAERLLARLQRAARAAMRRRGSSLEVVIGAAVCPEDGREAATLAAHADVGLYAARSAARAAHRQASAVDESG